MSLALPIDRVERRAIELADCLRRSESGTILLPVGWEADSSAGQEHAVSLQAMALLVERKIARPTDRNPDFPFWPAFALADAVVTDEVDDDPPCRIRTSRVACLPGCPYAEPEHGRGACDECSSTPEGEP